jgi:hypothetical protein
MLEVADIIRLHGAAYYARFGPSVGPSQRRALRDLQVCRTPACGGHVQQCAQCGRTIYAYHSCRNRTCPKCHRAQTERWVAQHRARLLPCPYYLLTFTLPAELRALARDHAKAVYGLLMQSAAAALQILARDPRYVGGRLGALAVLHTWTRALLYHPHVHLLVTAGGLAPDGTQWLAPQHSAYLVPVQALSVIFRAKLCAGLKKAGFLTRVPPAAWHKSWVVHCQPAGRGEQVLDYLGRYVFRIGISNSRLEQIADGQVTFRYRDNRTHALRHVTLAGVEFLQRFLQHVLPRGCPKVRYYGLWSPTCRGRLEQARMLLSVPPVRVSEAPPALTTPAPAACPPHPARCPHCQGGVLILLTILRPHRSRSP